MWSSHASPFAGPEGLAEARPPSPTLLGCGEEALTLWALTSCARTFLLQLQDPTPAEDVVVFFRPTFGRARMAGPRSVRAELGRFDAIVRTGRAVYLVDTRWHRSGDVADEPLFVGASQQRRHVAFREYLEYFKACAPEDWTDVEGALGRVFEERGLCVRPPPADSHLASRLEFVLRRCARDAVPVEDVLLLVAPRGWARVPEAPEGYRLVQLEYEPLDGSEYVSLTPPGAP